MYVMKLAERRANKVPKVCRPTHLDTVGSGAAALHFDDSFFSIIKRQCLILIEVRPLPQCYFSQLIAMWNLLASFNLVAFSAVPFAVAQSVITSTQCIATKDAVVVL